MKTTCTICDASTGSKEYQFTLNVLNEQLTVQELICTRVSQEVLNYNLKQPTHYRGLVQPSDAEQTLNGFRLRSRRQLDQDEECNKALKAFQENQFLLLLDNRQLTELDEEITIKPGSLVTFLKLIPLVGG